MNGAAWDFARSLHQQQVLVETAGLFWLLAELVILFAILLGRHHLDTSAANARVQWTPRFTRRALVWGILFAALVLLTYGRHVFLPPVHELLLSADASPSAESLAALLRRRSQTHLVLWGLFITGWVLIEGLIVYHGWRGYRRLREVIRHA